MTLAEFKIQFPEFASAWADGDTFVAAMLAAAADKLDSAVWADLYDQGHGCLTAHMLATAPNGQMARLATDKGESTYGKEFRRLQDIAAGGIRVF